MDSSHIEQSFGASFSSGTMTMMSVVLGVSLYFTVLAIQKASGNISPEFVVKTFLVLIIIPGMFHMYHYVTALVMNPPTFVTSLPLFLIGASLAVAAASLEPVNSCPPCPPCPSDENSCTREYLFYGAFVVFYLGCCLAFLLTRAIAIQTSYTVSGISDPGILIVRNSSLNCVLYAFLLLWSLLFLVLACIYDCKPLVYPYALLCIAVLYLAMVSVRMRLLDIFYKVLSPNAVLIPKNLSGGLSIWAINAISKMLLKLGNSKFVAGCCPRIALVLREAGSS
jgi:hypothetical protein